MLVHGLRTRFWKVVAATSAAGIAITFLYGYKRSSSTHETKKVNINGSMEIEALKGKEPFVSVPKREEQLSKLKQTKEFDLLVIGGGATGTGIALDAVTRGLSVGLVEREDFSCGTSSRSTKLVHGGVRYLEHAMKAMDPSSLALVFEALHERSVLLYNAPHLTQAIPIMTPCYKWWEIPYYYTGLKIYDILSGTHRIYWSHWERAQEVIRTFPTIAKQGLKGAVIYYDGQMNDSRVNVTLALTAASKGAVIANHVEVLSLNKDQKEGVVNGANVRDTLTGEEFEVRAKVVINATGPFSDTLRRMDDPKAVNIIAPSSGVHVTLPDYYCPSTIGLIVPRTKDNRVLFLLPWQGKSIAGTTDKECEVTALPVPQDEDIQFILETLSKYLSIPVKREDVLSAWCGIRPLAKDVSKKSTASISRDHVILVSPSKMITIAGGKWTTYRSMAQNVVDKAIEVGSLKPLRGCQTKHLKLLGAENWDESFFAVIAQNYRRMKTSKVDHSKSLVRISSDIANHLSHSYGIRAERVAMLAENGLGDRLVSTSSFTFGSQLSHQSSFLGDRRVHETLPYLEAEVCFAAQEEMACTAVDVLARRLRLAFLDIDAAILAVPRVVSILSDVLHWDEVRQRQECEETLQFLRTMSVSYQESSK